MSEAQGLPARLAALGLSSRDVDLVFLGHLHFDHAGGLHDFAHADVHVHARELVAAREPADIAYFADDFAGSYRWRPQQAEYELVPGVRAIETPGHAAGHMSMLVELPEGAPILVCGATPPIWSRTWSTRSRRVRAGATRRRWPWPVSGC
jgi:N-acyl homoserine lactone hydrolase